MTTAFFSDRFFTWLITGSLVLTGITSVVLVALLLRDWLKKEIW
jgi:hypothetical protein